MTVKEFKVQYALGSLTHSMKEDLAFNPGTPMSVLTVLSKDEDWSIRHWVAKNPNTSKKILITLSKDTVSIVRAYAVYNMQQMKVEKEERVSK